MKKLKEHVQVQCYYRTSISAQIQICSGLWGPRFRPSHPKQERAMISKICSWSRNVDETIPFTGTIAFNLSGFMKHATEVRYKNAEQRRIVKTQAILLTR